ncbi:phosphotransferase family protein [Vallicoccus soli]|uniref:Aminoglycoside phosphotransferase family protein n=1 Tax=Vallicoccus soli TaxID=2339232 RepID=A0A3A3Z0S7_9ACTN|nr:phosphotransferase [Vallicoccus soli]RJK96111.1 aminoglycoside phosphotransferase family protein [Vallicoccus soli]
MPSPRDLAEAALREHLPALARGPLRPLGQGLDHSAYEVAGHVLRVGDPGGLLREDRLLRLVGPRLPVAVPEPVLVDTARGVGVQRLLPGAPLLGRAVGPRVAVAVGTALGRALRVLHAVPPGEVTGTVPEEDLDPAARLEGLDEGLAGLGAAPALLDRLRAAVPSPAPRRVLAHADLGAEHLLEAGGRLTGVVDWGDAALADPALDLARPCRDLDPPAFRALLDAYGGPPDDGALARVRFLAACAALEDLAHGTATGQPAYATAARRALARLLPG